MKHIKSNCSFGDAVRCMNTYVNKMVYIRLPEWPKDEYLMFTRKEDGQLKDIMLKKNIEISVWKRNYIELLSKNWDLFLSE